MSNEMYQGRRVMLRVNEYVIVPCDMAQHAHEWFRVVNTNTGDESSLYSFDECHSIVRAARAGALRGSFDIGQ